MSVELLATWVGLAVCCGGFIWNAALMAARIKQNSKDINGLGQKVKNLDDALEDYRDRFDLKLDKAIDKLEHNITAVRTEMNNANNALARIEGVLQGLTKKDI